MRRFESGLAGGVFGVVAPIFSGVADSRPPDPWPTRPPPRSASLSLEAKRAFGGLLALIDMPDLRDILIHVTDGVGRLWIDVDGRLQQLEWQLAPTEVRSLAIALIAAGNRHLDELHPCANVRLGDGIRVHALLPPISTSGAVISIRVPRAAPMSFDELVAGGFCSNAHAQYLRAQVVDRRNFLLVGGTGSGKTTALAALLDLVPSTERIITIEDVAELRLTHPHWVALEARQANAEGTGAFGLDSLVQEALRMRPDRIVLGECRGAELLTLLTALNTGHDGGAGTLHANGFREVAARLEALGALGGMPAPALARQAYSALHVIVHVERTATGHHRLAGLGKPRLSGDALTIETLWSNAASRP